MKRIILPLISLPLLVSGISSCTSADSKQTDTVSDTLTSVAAEEVEAFTSPDLQWKELQGNVKQCVVTRYEAFLKDSICIISNHKAQLIDTLCFTKSGLIEHISMHTYGEGLYYAMQNTTLEYDADGVFQSGFDTLGNEMNYDVTLRRNEEGYVTELYRFIKDSEIPVYGDEMVWENGRVKECTFFEYDLSSTWKRRYDEDGRLIEEKSTFIDTDEGSEIVLKYNYVDTDSIGNWVERHLTNEIISINYDLKHGTETRTPQPPIYYVERREITYYDK